MAGTLVKRVMLKITADDGDTESKLDRITAKADELSRMHPELKVKIDAGAAAAKMALLRKELKDTGKEADRSGGGFRAAAMGLSGFGDSMTLFSADASMGGKMMAGLSLATGLLEPVAAGAIVGVGGIGAAAVTAGAGLGIFGLVAKGVVGKVEAADQAGKHLTGSLGYLQTALGGAKSEWSKFVTAASPGVTSVIAGGLRLLPEALSMMKPFLATVESALKSITGEVGKAAKSPFWQSFDKMLAGHAGGDIKSLGGIIGHIATGLAGIVKAFTPMASTILRGLDHMTAGFAKCGKSLSGHSGFKSLMSEAKEYAPAIGKSLENIGKIASHLVGDMAGTKSLVPIWTKLLPPITGILDKLVKANPAMVQFGLYALGAGDGLAKIGKGISGISNGISGLQSAAGLVKTLGIKMGLLKDASAEAAVATDEEAGAQDALDGAMDANPIGLIVIAVAAVALGIIELTKHSKAFRVFWIDAWKVIKSAALDAWHFLDNDVIHPIEHGIAHVVDWVKDHWKLLATIIGTILLGPIGGLVIYVATHWKQISSLTERLVGDVVRFFEGIPHFLASLPGKLLTIGKNIVMGLVHGIESMFGAVGGAVKHLADLVPKGLSDVLHMLSPSKVTHYHGQMIGQGLINGMDSMHGAVTAAAARMARAAGLPGTASGYGGAGAGRPLQLELKVSVAPGSDAGLMEKLIHSLRYEVRVKGGQVQTVLGH